MDVTELVLVPKFRCESLPEMAPPESWITSFGRRKK